VLALGALVLGGCGSSSSGSTSSSASTPTTASSATTPPAAASTPSSTTPAAGGASSSQLEIAANAEGQLKYTKSTLSAAAGKVTVSFTNSSPLAHNFTVASASGATVGATPTFQGGSKSVTLNLKPGTYKFFCTVPGHRMAGMEGTLTVK
jgi:plastocyanin